MIHILNSNKINKKTKKHETYFIEYSQRNGRILSTSETHSYKKRTVDNIAASMKVFNSVRVTVVDHSQQYNGRVVLFDIVRKVVNGKIKYMRTSVRTEKIHRGWKRLGKRVKNGASQVVWKLKK